jgi:hypothetical protein
MFKYIDFFGSCRLDGTDFYLISSPFLHMFDQTMSMLPFATRTDMFEAIKKADAKASDAYAFLATLLAEHYAVGARAQLRTLWVAHVREKLLEDDGGLLESGAGEGLRVSSGSVCNWAPTPPNSPRADGGPA